MHRSYVLAALSATVLLAVFGAALAQAPEPAASEPTATDSIPPALSSGPLPLAAWPGGQVPRHYPCFDIAAAMHTFPADLSGLAEVYGGTPSFGLSPVLGAAVELHLAPALGVQADAGVPLAGGESRGAQGMLGLVCYVRPSRASSLRTFVGAGAAFASFHGEASGIATDAGKIGYYMVGGLTIRLGRREDLDLFGGYGSYPRVTGTHTVSTESGPVEKEIQVDLSGPILGLRLKTMIQ